MIASVWAVAAFAAGLTIGAGVSFVSLARYKERAHGGVLRAVLGMDGDE